MKKLLIGAVLLVLGALGCTTVPITPTLLPGGINLPLIPRAEIRGIKDCLGISWNGNWDNKFGQSANFVLEKLEQTRILTIYAWGAYEGTPGNWKRVSGRIIDNSSVVLEMGDKNQPIVITLTLVGGETILAEYRRGTKVNHATLTKTKKTEN